MLSCFMFLLPFLFLIDAYPITVQNRHQPLLSRYAQGFIGHFRLYAVDEDENQIPSLKVNENEETYFKLSPKKRVTFKEWEGNVLLDIREYYKKNEQELPGKKGISLTIDQYKIMRDLIMDGTVDDILKELGGEI